MYCEDCKKEIPASLDHCPDCNKFAQLLCLNCQGIISLTANFCSQCGKKVRASTTSNLQNDLRLSTGRRHITVMFCDLVGSTGLSTLLDPEDLSELLVKYRDLCMQIIKKWDGYVADFQGDGVMIYFGYPIAHEDDSQRAVYAALDIVEKITEKEILPVETDMGLAVRIGINSGRAVVGDIGTGEVVESMGIVGETPNIAAKIQSLAGKNEIVLSESTYRYVKELFRFEYLGKLQVKGVINNDRAYKVKEVVENAERFQGKSRAGDKKITGRDDELVELKEAWCRCEKKGFVSIAVTGEAGIGKSRLLWAFRQWLQNRAQKFIVFNCSPYHTQTALYPFIEVIGRGGSKDKIKTKRRLKILFERLNNLEKKSIDINVELLLDFIYGRRLQVDPEKYKNQIYEILVLLAKKLAKKTPLLIVVEDLHWIDPTTWEFFLKFMNSKEFSNICLLVTSRNQTHLDLPVHTHLQLGPLSNDQSAELINNVIQNVELPKHLLNQLIESCKGNPLYLEESARYLSELNILQQDNTRQKLHLVADSISFSPESLHDLFMSRLDRLSQEKWLAQLASAIGSQFEINILKAVADIETNDFEQTLKRLIEADIFYQVDGHNGQLYEFKHILLRNATHDALLRTQRHSIHQKIINAYQHQQPGLWDQQPELLAYHYTQVGNDAQAIIAWQLAGTKAQRLSANVEAVSHFRKALKLLNHDDVGIKLKLLTQMGPSLMAVESWASKEVESLYKKAAQLSRIVCDKEQLFTSLRGLWGNNFLRGDLDGAQQISEQLEQLANSKGSDELKIESVLSKAMEKYWLGDFQDSEKLLNQIGKLYDPNKHKEHAYVFSVDPGVVSLFYESRNLWSLGYPDQALEKVKASVTLAEKQEHFPSLTWGLGFYAAVHFDRGEYDCAKQIAERDVKLSQQHHFPIWEAWGHVLSGSSIVAISRQRTGLESIEKGIDMYQATGAGIALPYFYSLYASSLLRLKNSQQALNQINEGLARVEANSISSSIVELLRLKALALFATTKDTRQSLKLLEQSIMIARQQQARSMYLRSLLSRVAITGQVDPELSEVFAQFSEGFSSSDLIAAKKLLDSG